MAVVIGVDFGTLSVRASVVDSEKGLLESAVAEYPLHRKREDPEFATQSHTDHMQALAVATRQALKKAAISGNQIEAIALDTTGSSVIPVGKDMQPLDDYYLWCDHRAKGEAAEITEAAHREGLEAIQWCGGVYSSEWGFSKLLHWLRHNPAKRSQFVSAFEHCDMVAATLSGIVDSGKVKRSVCAMGAEHGVTIKRVINAGGIPQKNNVLNQVYANILKRPVLVPSSNVVGLGSAIFAFLAAKTFKTVEEAQKAICPAHKIFEPQDSEERVYDQLYPLYRKLYFALGSPADTPLGDVMPKLIRLAESVNRTTPVLSA